MQSRQLLPGQILSNQSFLQIRNPGDGAGGGLTSRQKEGADPGSGSGVGVGGRGFASRSTPALAKPPPASSQVVVLPLLETRSSERNVSPELRKFLRLASANLTRYTGKDVLRLLILNFEHKIVHKNYPKI